MRNIEIKEWYEHEQKPSIFVMMRADYQLVWSFSGNELRRVYLENPEDFLSVPLELSVSAELYQALDDDDF